VNNINSDTSISVENGHASYNLVGGIFGAVSSGNLVEISNCASYLSIIIDTDNCYVDHNYFGAFGSMSVINNTISVSNIFSKVKTNKINDSTHGYSAYHANAIIGETNHAKQKDGTRIGGYEFNNLFGIVEQVDTLTGESVKSTQLYELSSQVDCSEKNCFGCEILPDSHGFDTSLWDLTDMSNPKVILN